MLEEMNIQETLDVLNLGIALRQSVLVTLDGFDMSDLDDHAVTVKAAIEALSGIDKVPHELSNLDENEAAEIISKVEQIVGFEIGEDWASIAKVVIRVILELIKKVRG